MTRGLFSLSNAGVLGFIASPDYESPKDQGENNDYEVTIQASDGTNDAVINVTVRVENVDEDPVVTGDTGPSVVEGSKRYDQRPTALMTLRAKDDYLGVPYGRRRQPF